MNKPFSEPVASHQAAFTTAGSSVIYTGDNQTNPQIAADDKANQRLFPHPDMSVEGHVNHTGLDVAPEDVRAPTNVVSAILFLLFYDLT